MQSGFFSIRLANRFFALLDLGVTNACGIVSKNVETVSVKQFGLILLPTHQHLLQLLIRIAMHKNIVVVQTIVMQTQQIHDGLYQLEAIHCC